MRKHWRFNRNAWLALAAGWFFVGMVLVLATLDQQDPKVKYDSTARGWALLLWLGPYGLLVFGVALYGLWRWLTSDSGWFVKRVWEPVRDDLRDVS